MKYFLYGGRIAGKVSSFYEASKIVLVLWILSAALSVPPLLGWGRYVPEFSGLG
jgi:hypothetical protein